MLGGIRRYVGCQLCQKRLRLSSKVDECKPLPQTRAPVPRSTHAWFSDFSLKWTPRGGAPRHPSAHPRPPGSRRRPMWCCRSRPRGRGLHSSTIWLNLSALSGIGGACRACFRSFRGRLRCISCQKRLRWSRKCTSVRPCRGGLARDLAGGSMTPSTRIEIGSCLTFRANARADARTRRRRRRSRRRTGRRRRRRRRRRRTCDVGRVVVLSYPPCLDAAAAHHGMRRLSG